MLKNCFKEMENVFSILDSIDKHIYQQKPLRYIDNSNLPESVRVWLTSKGLEDPMYVIPVEVTDNNNVIVVVADINKPVLDKLLTMVNSQADYVWIIGIPKALYNQDNDVYVTKSVLINTFKMLVDFDINMSTNTDIDNVLLEADKNTVYDMNMVISIYGLSAMLIKKWYSVSMTDAIDVICSDNGDSIFDIIKTVLMSMKLDDTFSSFAEELTSNRFMSAYMKAFYE